MTDMNTDLKVKNGTLVIQQITFKRILVRNVVANDPKQRQGKIALPKDLIGKQVYVVVEPENDV